MDATALLEQNTDSNKNLRNNFTDHLYNALIDADITAFMDDEEIETGEDLKPKLEDAIRSSRASIVVLSKNYATSKWCLDELALILDQRLTSDHMVIPIFYHVDPTDVRKQQNSFGDAMAEHRQKKMEAETNTEKRVRWGEKMDRWNKALTDVADLKWKDVKGRPPSLDKVSLLPLLWSSKKHIQFFMDVTELFEQLNDCFQQKSRVQSQFFEQWKMPLYITYERDYYACFKPKSRVPSKLFKQWKKMSQYITYECDDYACLKPKSRVPSELFKQWKIMSRYITYERHYYACFKPKSRVPSELFEQWKKMYNTCHPWCLLQTSRSPWACEARDIADKLQFGKRPPSLDKVSLHPFLWSSEKRIQFFMDAIARISDVPIGLLSDILSLTSPVDACRAAAVSNIFKAVADSDYVWHKFLPLDLHEIIARAVSNVVFHSQKELYFLLSDSYILLDRGTLGFKLDKESGKKCYMLAARHLSIAWHDDKRYWEWGHMPESRFAEVGMLKEVWCLDIHGIITTAMLSPKTMYVAYLVFLTTRWSSGLNVPAKTIVTVGGIRNETSNVYLQRPGTKAQAQVSHTMRKDGWMEIPLGEFYCDDGDEGEVEMVFEELVYWKAGLIVEGIEVRPK